MVNFSDTSFLDVANFLNYFFKERKAIYYCWFQNNNGRLLSLKGNKSLELFSCIDC